MQYQE